MLVFRSEEHLGRWLESTGHALGAAFSLAQMQAVADGWYRDKATPGYRRRTPAEAQALFEAAGLTGPFWDLTGTPARRAGSSGSRP